MSTVPEIVKLGAPSLREISEPVLHFGARCQGLVHILNESVVHYGGMGLAAPQIGINKRAVIIRSFPNERYPYAPEMSPIVMFNPAWRAVNSTLMKGWEGCLSVADRRGLVPRFLKIEVSWQDSEGQLQVDIFSSFIARVIQHEVDHLDGKVFTDRILRKEDLMDEATWKSDVLPTLMK